MNFDSGVTSSKLKPLSGTAIMRALLAFASEASENLKANVQNLELEIAQELDSTNKILQENLKNKTKTCALIAQRQTSGRGRLARKWYSEEFGSITLSVGFNLPKDTEHLASFTILAGLKICQNLRKSFGDKFLLKWPNDIYFDGKKLSGMLANLRVDSDSLGLVFGVGFNCNLTSLPPEIADTAVSLSAGVENIDRDFCAALIIFSILQAKEALLNFDSINLPEEFKEFDYLNNRAVKADLGGETIDGLARGITKKGELLIEKNNQSGDIHVLNSGEAFLKK